MMKFEYREKEEIIVDIVKKEPDLKTKKVANYTLNEDKAQSRMKLTCKGVVFIMRIHQREGQSFYI